MNRVASSSFDAVPVEASSPLLNYQTVSAKRRGRVLEISLNRPAQLNAVNALMHRELTRLFIDADRDEGSDVLLLRGEGRAFCAGGDIGWMQAMIDEPREFARTAREGRQIVNTLLDCEKPIVAAVHGAATGLGATMALLCDVIFMADDATLSDPHVRIGLVAGDGGAVIWPQLIGYARAKEYLLTGKPVPARDAQQMGLVNHAVAAGDLQARALAFAQELASGPQVALRGTKMAVNIGLKQLTQSVLDASLAYEALSNLSADHQEAVTAFREKRSPVFTGA